MDLKDVIKQRRKKLGITQIDLAEISEISIATIKDIERGKGNPSLSTVKKLLGILGMEIEYKIKTPFN